MTDPAISAAQQQFLTFVINDEYFGVDILRVQEIRGWTGVRRIPNLPDFIKGILPLRGHIVPIVDLRVRFGDDSVEYGPTTVVIVVTIMHEGESQLIGLVVDAVADVIIADSDEFSHSPPMGVDIDTRFIDGVVVRGDLVTVIVAADCILNDHEVVQLSDLKVSE